MKHRLLDILSCPACRHALMLLPESVVQDEDGEITEGELTCDNDHFYPVISGVPRLLLPQLLSQALRDYHPEVYQRYAQRLQQAGAEIADVEGDDVEGEAKKRTQPIRQRIGPSPGTSATARRCLSRPHQREESPVRL